MHVSAPRTTVGVMDDATRALRVTAVNAAPVAAKGRYVLYWMIAARRTTWSFALDHAVAVAKQLARPLVVFEPLRAGYPWACDRFHAFVMQGMADNAKRIAASGVGEANADRSREGSAARALHPRPARARQDRRPDLERRAAPAPRRWPDPQLPPHAVGQEDPRLVEDPAGSARDLDRAQQRVRRRRPRSEFVQRPPVEARPVRSPVGSGTADLRDDPLHVIGRDEEEARYGSVPRELELAAGCDDRGRLEASYRRTLASVRHVAAGPTRRTVAQCPRPLH